MQGRRIIQLYFLTTQCIHRENDMSKSTIALILGLLLWAAVAFTAQAQSVITEQGRQFVMSAWHPKADIGDRFGPDHYCVDNTQLCATLQLLRHRGTHSSGFSPAAISSTLTISRNAESALDASIPVAIF
jgi:hypothetical protein